MRLHRFDASSNLILIPETADLVGLLEVASLIGRIRHPAQSLLLRGRFFSPVVGNLNRSKGANGTPSKAYTSSVPGQHSLYHGGQHMVSFYA